MVLRLRSTVGNVILLLGLGMLVLGGGGLATGALTRSEGLPVTVIGFVLAIVGTRVRRGSGF